MSSRDRRAAAGPPQHEVGPLMLLGVVWVFVFGGIALVGLVMLVAYAVWLAHKAADVMSEVRVLADRAEQLADLLGQIRAPDPVGTPGPRRSNLTAAGHLEEAAPT